MTSKPLLFIIKLITITTILFSCISEIEPDFDKARTEMCESTQECPKDSTGTVTDPRDGKTYTTAILGEQVWMSENLNYGDYIKELEDSTQFLNSKEKFCPDNYNSSCNLEGGLYQWHSAMGFPADCSKSASLCNKQISTDEHQGICMDGWHLPKSDEWNELAIYLGGVNIAGDLMKDFERDTDWLTDTDHSAQIVLMNQPSFLAITAGFRYYKGGLRNREGGAYFWEASEHDDDEARYRFISRHFGELDDYFYWKSGAFSVRCVKNKEGN